VISCAAFDLLIHRKKGCPLRQQARMALGPWLQMPRGSNYESGDLPHASA
jgi:hypothetical protein